MTNEQDYDSMKLIKTIQADSDHLVRAKRMYDIVTGVLIVL